MSVMFRYRGIIISRVHTGSGSTRKVSEMRGEVNYHIFNNDLELDLSLILLSFQKNKNSFGCKKEKSHR